MLELKDISKTYKVSKKEYKILDDLSINFRKKGLVCILGKSGSGKTTFLNIVGLLDNDYKGKIYLYGNDISKYKEYLNDKLIRSKIGFVFQDYNLIENLSVFENVNLALMIKGKNIKNNRIFLALKKCNIIHLKDKKVSTLSGGEKQRVAICRCLITNPDIILLDEPTGALDSQSSEKILILLKKIFYNKLVIMVTHDKRLAKKYSDRLIILNDGKILYDSNPYLIKTKKKLYISNKKMLYLDNFKYSLKSLRDNKLLNSIIAISLIISIILISLVLFITNGFKDKINEYEKNTFINYPLIITRKSSKKVSLNKINRYNPSTNIYLEKNFITSFKKFAKKNNIKYLVKYNYNFNLNNTNISFSSYLDSNYLKKNYKLLSGSYPKNKNEIVINIENDYLDGKLFDYYNIKENTCNYKYFLNKELYLSDINKKLLIKGIVTSKSKLSFSNLISNSTILYNKDLDSLIPIKNEYSIYVFTSKELVKSYLEANTNIKYQDIGDSIELNLKNIITSIESIFLVFSFISLFISSFLIFSITYTRGIERKKEIGILKSLGARKKDIRRIFINEAIIISIISTIISLVLVRISISFINHILYNITSLDNIIIFKLKIVLYVTIISILTGFVGSFIPAHRNSNKDVLKCLK